MSAPAGRIPGIFRNRIMFGIMSGWGAQMVSLALGVLTMPLFFRYLPQEELGVWMFILGTGLFVNLADLGFSPVLGRQLAFELGKGDREARPNHTGASYYFSLSRYVSNIPSSILLCVMLLPGGLFIWALGLPHGLLASSLEAWAIFCLAQTVTCRFKYLETALNSHGEVGWQNWAQAAVQSLTLLGYFMALYLWQGGIVVLSIVVLGRNILNAILLGFLVRGRVDKAFRERVRVAWRDVRPHLRPALDFFLIGLGGFLVLNTDQYFIVKFLGTAALPDYAAAYRLVQVFYVFSSTVSQMCVPFISRRSGAAERTAVHRMLMLNTTVGMIIQIAAVSVLAVFGDYIMQLWLGKGHFVGWGVLWVFCAMLTLENHHVIFARFGQSSGTDSVWGKMAVLAGVINLVLTYIGVMWLGLLGVALGTMVAQVLTNNWYAVAKSLEIVQMRFLSYMRGSGVVWAATGAVLLALMSAIRALVPWPMASLLAGISVTGILCSGVMYFYLRKKLVAV